MGDKSKIEWTDATWNPVVGCSRWSHGCAKCYAIRDAYRMAANPNSKISQIYEGLVKRQRNGQLDWTGVLRLIPERLEIPLHWKKPRRVFVNSQSDLFHDDVPFEFIQRVWQVMQATPQHIYQILTKRPPYMQACSRELPTLPNVWLGVSVENQQAADQRIPYLLRTRAALRFLSCEPLLGPLDLSAYLPLRYSEEDGAQIGSAPGVDWVIAGGESGPGARPMHPDWVRDIRDDCHDAGVAFFFKQWGEWAPTEQVYRVYQQPGGGPIVPARLGLKRQQVGDEVMWRLGKKRAGRLLDGRTWDEYPVERSEWGSTTPGFSRGSPGAILYDH